MGNPRLSWPLLFSLLVSLANLGTEAVVPMDIFILAGQSNMAGRERAEGRQWSGYVPPECKPDARILRLSAARAWEEAREPHHSNIDAKEQVCGVGSGMAYANEVVRARGLSSNDAELGLVPCAVGRTSIAQWGRGSPLYVELLLRASQSTVNVKSATIRALLWFQGESDTVTKEDAEAYRANMERFITNVRSELNITNLLIIQVPITSGLGPFVKVVRRAQSEMKLAHVKCVDAKGLELGPDNFHPTTEAVVNLGYMLALAYLAPLF